MKKNIVSKFGGSSVEDAIQIEKVRKIVEDSSSRRYIVVSAPGREKKYNIKITDHLFNIATEGNHLRANRKKIAVKDSKDAVLLKFKTLINDLALTDNDILAGLSKDFETELTGDKKVAFLASRGEHYNAKLIANYFNRKDIPTEALMPEDIGLQVSDSILSAKVTEKARGNLAKLKDRKKKVIIPGYYGVTEAGDVAVLSRGGSDLTGGELAAALHASVYENWTDTDGVYEADPRLIKEADIVPRLTYKEIRLLSAKGFNVFHFDAMMNCKKAGVPINIRNTNKRSAPGTLILSERVPEEDVVGIARLDNMAFIYLEKDMLGETIGFTKDLLTIFKKYEINTYHYPTDKDDISIIVNQDDIQGKINDLRGEIEETLQPDLMEVRYNISILSPVGLGIKDNPIVLAQAATVLCENHINIEMLDQSPAQICFHIGVQQAHADDAYKSLYEKLILKQD
ncbi:MAG: aspartate kinase [Lentisphaeraceae bacterium]|nr:aspartate kinase [Lentisphaeraceae bacterium]